MFTGYDGGISDLFIVNADGSNLRRLTNDKYADLHPVWSPDGKTHRLRDRSRPRDRFQDPADRQHADRALRPGGGRIEVLPEMDEGKNVSPQWSPDGKSIAFVSDRTGVSNIYLYDLTDQQVYQLTDLFTGAQGITPLSPVLSWARRRRPAGLRLLLSRQVRRLRHRQPAVAQEGDPWQPAHDRLGDCETQSVWIDPPTVIPVAATPPSSPHAITAARPVESSGSIYRAPRGIPPGGRRRPRSRTPPCAQ